MSVALATADSPTLGAATEARFAAAFAGSALITRKAAAELLGLDVKTLDALVAGGLLRTVRRGKLAAFIERDLRAFLTAEDPPPCRSIAPQTPASGSLTSGSKVVAFTARPARLRVAPPKP